MRLRPPRLDRIVRGRAWIPVLGALLVAIVGLRVEVLKLGSGVGAQVQQATLLESSNSVLRSQISALSDSSRIIKLGEDYGMHMPSPLDVHIVQAAAGTHVQAAMHNISAPSRTAFLGGLVAEQQANQGTQTAVTGTGGTGAPSSTTGTGLSASGSLNSATTSGTTPGTAATGTSASGSASTATSGAGLGASGTSTPNTLPGGGSTSGGTGSVNTTVPNTSGAADTSQNTGSAPGSTTGGSGLAG